ncbi:TniQ family protein [Rhizobium sp. Leaf383]|uniref:TniQ family protein n=1 Tax=Rhizobium sp. Leaf383 TaxID=1736357 RepID=UPI000712651D|nr:TniQ family protein [Rhizobium sp. Leaf383]KQS76439.1 hypothetical protein ASG58_11500 [Rhizobium sp. Leaf383]
MSDAIATFTLVPSVREYETPGSFISRLSAYNCLDSVATLYRLTGARSGRAHAASSQRRLLDMAGVDATSFCEDTSARRNFVALNGHDIKTSQLCRHLPRYCPVCVTEDIASQVGPVGVRSFQRFWWQWSLIGSCHRHGCDLVTSAKEAVRGLPDFASYIVNHMKKIEAEAVAVDVTAGHVLDSYLMDRLMNRRSASTGILDTLPLHVAVNFCEHLGGFLENEYSRRRISRKENDFVRAGLELISEGEEKMFHVLRQRACLGMGKSGLSKTRLYGSLYSMLSTRLGDGEWQPLIKIFQRDAFQKLRLAEGENFLGATYTTPVDSVDGISLKYNVAPSYVVKILEQSGLSQKPARYSEENIRSSRSLSPAEIETAFGWVRSALHPKAASASLGLNREQLMAFGEAGFLRLVRVRCNSGVARRFSDESVEELLRDILALKPVTRMAGEYRSFLGAQKWPAIKPVDLWENVMAGKVSAVRRRECGGFSSVYVHLGDMLNLLISVGQDGHEEDESPLKSLPQHEVMKALRMRAQTVRRLQEIGVLTGFASSGNNQYGARFYYHRSRVDEFARQYASLSTLSEETRIPCCTIGRMFQRAGISPVFEPAVSSTRTALETQIYLRSDFLESMAKLAGNRAYPEAEENGPSDPA